MRNPPRAKSSLGPGRSHCGDGIRSWDDSGDAEYESLPSNRSDRTQSLAWLEQRDWAFVSLACEGSKIVFELAAFLRHALHQPRHSLHDVVVDHGHREEHQEDERRLINSLFYVEADIPLHQALDK